jgi:hypothetical protein
MKEVLHKFNNHSDLCLAIVVLDISRLSRRALRTLVSGAFSEAQIRCGFDSVPEARPHGRYWL